MHKLTRHITKLTAACAMAIAVAACEGINCTLNNVVMLNVGFYDSATGKHIELNDTIMVTATGTDSVLYNRGTKTSALTLPMSFWQAADTLTFTVYGENYEFEDFITISKTNVEHYESPDCPTTMFHAITGVDFASPFGTVDSIVVSKPSVNYDTQENLKIYYNSAALPE